MSTIVTRASKGSILTSVEMDANLDNLNADKIESNTAVTVVGDIAAYSTAGGRQIKVATAADIVGAIGATAVTNATNVTGTIASGVTATTQTAGDNSTKVATTAFVIANTPTVALSSGTGYSSNTTLTNSAYGQFIYLWGTMTLTLPVATVDNIGKTISLHCYTTGAITIATQSGQSIYAQGGSIGTTYPVMSAGDSLTLVNYNGTSWMAVSGSGGIGYGQTWQNVSGSRVNSTTYYNTTGKPIWLYAWSSQGGASGGGASLTVNGVTVSSTYSSSSNVTWPVSGIIPPGSSYSVAMVDTRGGWVELR